MTDQVVSKNIGALITVRAGSVAYSITAGSTNDATNLTGISIDREDIVGDQGALPLSMVAGLVFDATMASGGTLSVEFSVVDSANNSDWAVYASETYAIVATSVGAAISGQRNFNVNLSSARRYIRVDTLVDLSRAGTDTAMVRAVAVLAGFDRLAAAA
jgi:hypothetical protein